MLSNVAGVPGRGGVDALKAAGAVPVSCANSAQSLLEVSGANSQATLGVVRQQVSLLLDSDGLSLGCYASMQAGTHLAPAC